MAKTIKRTGKFTLPSNLSFRRSIDVSDGLLSSVMPDGTLLPVEVECLTVRGALGASTAGYDKKGNPLVGEALEKAQHNPNKPNIQSIDRATLHPDSDTLDLAFSMAFHGNQMPDACSKAEYRAALAGFLENAVVSGLYEDLAARYLWNIVNGRALWRNGFGAAAPSTLSVECSDMGMLSTKDRTHVSVSFDWTGLASRDLFPGVDVLASAFDCAEENVTHLIAQIASALQGERHLLTMDVNLRVRTYRGAEVWPSQEFAEETQKKRGTREISRILSSRRASVQGETIRQGTMHSQKIGNAIRTVDEWHGSPDFGAISVEAFGWVQRELAAVRAPSNANGGIDAYRALENVASISEGLLEDDVQSRKDGLYVLGILIRGGVWGVSEKEEATVSATA